MAFRTEYVRVDGAAFVQTTKKNGVNFIERSLIYNVNLTVLTTVGLGFNSGQRTFGDANRNETGLFSISGNRRLYISGTRKPRRTSSSVQMAFKF